MNRDDDHYLKRELYELIQHDPSVFDFLQAGSLDGLWYWDLETPEHEWMNSAFWELMGYDPAEKKHLTLEWQNLIHPDDLKVALDNFRLHCENPEHPYDQIVRYRHKDGSTVWVRCRGLAIRDSSGKPIRMLGAHNDLTKIMNTEEELKIRNEELKKLAHYDSLTSLFNRHSFQEHFESQLLIAARQESALPLLIIDIDHFKLVNDRFGHLKGDEVLRSVAHVIRDTVRDSDLAARFGGDEFVILLFDTAEESSVNAGERFHAAIESHARSDCAVTVSVGAATFSNTKNGDKTLSQQCNKLLDQADKALYFAKENGRNQVSHFNTLSL